MTTQHARPATPREPPARRPGALRSATVFALAAALQRGLQFVLLPLYTRALTPAEYGVLSLVLSVAAAFAILFAFGLDLSIFRTFFEYADDPKRQARFVSSIWRFLLVVPLTFALAIGTFAWVFLGHVGRVSGPDILLALISAAFLVAATTVPLAILRAGKRLRDYLVVTGVAAMGTSGLTLFFVVVLHDGVTGWLIASCIANVCTLAAGAIVLPFQSSLSLDRAGVRRAVLFGLPLLPHFLSQWSLQLADRAICAGLVSAGALGIYSLAANLSVPVMVLVQSLNNGFMPSYATAGTDAAARVALSDMVVLQVAIVTLICLAGALLGGPFVSVASPASYQGAGRLVPWLVLGYGFMGFYYIPMNGATLGAGRGRFAWIATATSAATNVALLYIFVPRDGIYAAAVASAVGYLVLLATIAIYAAGRGNPVAYPWSRIVPALLLASLLFAASAMLTPSHGVTALAVRSLIVALAVPAILFVSLRRLPFPRRILRVRTN
jgi:O-antigen/teichoic acid export membrane protein